MKNFLKYNFSDTSYSQVSLLPALH